MFRCPECHDGDHLYRNADLWWDSRNQRWIATEISDQIDCTNCDHNCDISELESDDETI